MDGTIGIIGGMGPMATELFYKMVTTHTAASSDQDHIRMILLSDTSMPDRTAAIINGDDEKVRAQMLEDALLLQNSGCRALAVTCNTAHFFMDSIEQALDIPVIHMIRETAFEMSSLYPQGKIGIMATQGTIETGLYQQALSDCGLEPYIPKASVQKEIMYQIYQRVKAGRFYDPQSWRRIEEDYRNADCDCVLLACTELSVIKEQEHLNSWFADPMDILAKKVILFAGKEYKE